MKDNLLETLSRIVGERHLLSAAQVRERATHFWDSTPLTAKALVRPANTQETAEVLKACHSARQTVVTHGGVTGLVDGNHSTVTDIIISLERQKAIEELDPVGRTIVVQAGAVLQSVQVAAADAGFQLGIDLGARGSCTIGGNVATNAGGLSVLRYGMMREQILGLEVVLADGTVVSSMNKMMKNNAGYDLKQLFIGSEGTLGIVTRVVLRLRAATPTVNTALLAFNNFDSVTATLTSLNTTLNGTLDAFEVIWQPFYRLNTNPERSDTARAPLPPDYPVYAVIEAKNAAMLADSKPSEDTQFQDALEYAMEQGHVVDAAIAQSQTEAAEIWAIREHIDIALEHDPVFVYDISLPIAEMENYLQQLEQELKSIWPQVIVYVYGHLADGNLHVLVAPPSTDDTEDSKQWHARSNQIVYSSLQALGGSISAEHGIGLLKKPYLGMSRNAAEIALMKTLKQALDPAGILNPGKIFDI